MRRMKLTRSRERERQRDRETEQNEVGGMKKGADSTGEVMHI